MPRLSLYRSQKSNDYKFFDRIIKEQFSVGGTDLYVHKYLGINDNQVVTTDLTQPKYDSLDPTNIQDLLFLENRNRKYAPDIIRLRGHYNVQNLDFDLSQFGLFLNNDVIFITIHYNEMTSLVGRKLMVGDVLELPHLTDYHPLNETIPTSLRRYYQITDGNYASEGFSSTWYPHLWRIKCEPLVDSQEFSNILDKPLNKDTFLGEWTGNKIYPQGYVVSFGDKNYVSKSEVPANIPCTNTTYWDVDMADSLKDILSRYNKNIEINDAAIAEATRLLPASGYDRSQLYIAPLDENNKPAPPKNVIRFKGAPTKPIGVVTQVRTAGFNTPSPVIRIGAAALKSIWDMTADSDDTKLKEFVQMSLSLAEIQPERTETGSGAVDGTLVLSVKALGDVTGPYGTTDNIYSKATDDPDDVNFRGVIVQDIMDFRADIDPRYKFVQRISPKGYGYTEGYLAGSGDAPNGEPTGSGITFPDNPKYGAYFLRTDYLPQQLFRWDGQLWIKISEKVRTGTALGPDDTSLRSSFINNNNVTTLSDGTTIPERASLSNLFKIQPD